MPLIPALSLATAFALLACPAAKADIANRLEQIDDYVNAYVDMAAFDGVVLIVDGSDVVYRKAFGQADYGLSVPMSEDSVFRIASLSKQVTQAAIGRLVDRDILALESPLADFLPDFPNAKRISIGQLLAHTAGIAHTNQLAWMDMETPLTLDEIVAGLAGEPLLFSPGTDERYSNGGYALLAKVIEIGSGVSFGSFIETEFTDHGFPSIGHESAAAIVAGMAGRYAPGPDYGTRVKAQTYVTANRIGGGSLYANAEDVLRFFRSSYGGRLLAAETTAAIFERPGDGDIRVTGRAPGALAQIFLDFDDDLAVVTLSSNSAWPGSFNADITGIYRGTAASLTPFTLSSEVMSDSDVAAVAGDFIADRFGWKVSIEPRANSFVFIQDDIRTAFARTTSGEFHLPIYDWLCRYSDYGMEFECRQRDPDAVIRFRFTRQ